MYGARFEPLALGSDWVLPLEIKDSESGEPLGFGGCSFKVSLKSAYSEVPEINGTSENSQVINPQDGIIVIQMLASDLGSLRVGEYSVGLKVTSGELSEALVIGTLPVIDGVTS